MIGNVRLDKTPEELLSVWTRTLSWAHRRFEAENGRECDMRDARDVRRICSIYMMLFDFIFEVVHDEDGWRYGANWPRPERMRDIINGVGGEMVRAIKFPLER